MVTIGVLALQGAFNKHAESIRSLGASVRLVRYPSDLAACDGLILPGGESTTLSLLLAHSDLHTAIQAFAMEHAIFGTCAGAILLAGQLVDAKGAIPLAVTDLVIERNAYGRQNESFVTEIQTSISNTTFPAHFIRAPRILSIGEQGKTLASFEGEPVLVEHGNHLIATFHPELTADLSIHQYFLDRVITQSKQKALLTAQ